MWLRALLAAAVLVFAVVPATFAVQGPTHLSDAGVSDRSVSTAQAVTFTVAYRNREGSPADWVRVRVAGATHAMTRTSDEDWRRMFETNVIGVLHVIRACVQPMLQQRRGSIVNITSGGSVGVKVEEGVWTGRNPAFRNEPYSGTGFC